MKLRNKNKKKIYYLFLLNIFILNIEIAQIEIEELEYLKYFENNTEIEELLWKSKEANNIFDKIKPIYEITTESQLEILKYSTNKEVSLQSYIKTIDYKIKMIEILQEEDNSHKNFNKPLIRKNYHTLIIQFCNESKESLDSYNNKTTKENKNYNFDKNRNFIILNLVKSTLYDNFFNPKIDSNKYDNIIDAKIVNHIISLIKEYKLLFNNNNEIKEYTKNIINEIYNDFLIIEKKQNKYNNILIGTVFCTIFLLLNFDKIYYIDIIKKYIITTTILSIMSFIIYKYNLYQNNNIKKYLDILNILKKENEQNNI
jgi:hypothetical protein